MLPVLLVCLLLVSVLTTPCLKKLFRDDKCTINFSVPYWYPGWYYVDEAMQSNIGSFMCRNGTSNAICPGEANATVSIASATPSHYVN